MDFKTAVAFVLKHEGGLSNHASDPGRLTKFGISQRAYPTIDIANLTQADAEAIYRRDYWEPLKPATLDGGLALVAFDTAVNMGVGRAREWLKMVQNFQPAVAIETFLALREAYYKKLPTFAVFGKGWLARLSDLRKAVATYREPELPLPPVV